MPTRTILTALAASLTLATAALGHIFWLQPTTATPRVGEVLTLNLHVGDDFPGDILPRDPARIVKFIQRDPQGTTTDINGRSARAPAGFAYPKQPGLHVFAYQSNHAAVKLSGDKFTEYLKESGLDAIVALRAQRGQSSAEAHEIYSRCAKAIVAVANTNAPRADHSGQALAQPLGLRLEIQPQSDPTALNVGESLTIELTFEGQPLASALVTATTPTTPADPAAAVRVRTDTQGRATLPLKSAGLWVVSTVHMIEAPAGKAEGAQWESIWATLCFSIQPPVLAKP